MWGFELKMEWGPAGREVREGGQGAPGPEQGMESTRCAGCPPAHHPQALLWG